MIRLRVGLCLLNLMLLLTVGECARGVWLGSADRGGLDASEFRAVNYALVGVERASWNGLEQVWLQIDPREPVAAPPPATPQPVTVVAGRLIMVAVDPRDSTQRMGVVEVAGRTVVVALGDSLLQGTVATICVDRLPGQLVATLVVEREVDGPLELQMVRELP